MNVVITGGKGLLGTAIHNQVIAQDLQGTFTYLDSKDCDLRDEKAVQVLFGYLKPTHVIHLAARVGGLFDNLANNHDFYDSNVKINNNVLNVCNRLDVDKVVSCMSTCIFPANATLPLTVAQLHNGLPHFSNIGYSYAKRMLDIQNRILHKPQLQCFTGVIPTNLFGAHDNFDLERGHVIPALIHKCYLAKTRGQPLHVKGSGKAIRQFLYAPDAAKLILHVLYHYDDVEPLILAPPNEYSIAEVVEKIATIMEFDGEIIYESPEGRQEQDGQDRKTADGSKILDMMEEHGSAFKFTDFDTALCETIEWFCKNYDLSAETTPKGTRW